MKTKTRVRWLRIWYLNHSSNPLTQNLSTHQNFRRSLTSTQIKIHYRSSQSWASLINIRRKSKILRIASIGEILLDFKRKMKAIYMSPYRLFNQTYFRSQEALANLKFPWGKRTKRQIKITSNRIWTTRRISWSRWAILLHKMWTDWSSVNLSEAHVATTSTILALLIICKSMISSRK